MLFLFSLTVPEWCVLAAVVAAAILALCAGTSSHGPVDTIFVRGQLSHSNTPESPTIYASVRDDGSVALMRTGIDDLPAGSEISLAITKKGFDLSIEERTALPRDPQLAEQTPNCATFLLDFLGAERYHIKYNIEGSSRFAAFTLSVRPGLHLKAELKR